MTYLRHVSFAATLALLPTSASALDGVVTSIKPIHSLVAGVMGDTGTPHLLVRGAASPHTFALRPSDARALENAKLVFWIGPMLETALDGAIDTLGAGATVVEFADIHDLVKLPLREGGAFETHDHDHEEHGEHEHDEAGDHDGHDDHEDDHHAEAHDDDDHDHDGEHHAHEGGFDAHLWLDPQNAAVMVGEIAEALTAADPGNAATYAANAGNLTARLESLTTELAAELEPVKDRPFIVFHDAYHYFENRFGLAAAGSITVSPDVLPGAERLAEIRAKIAQLGATCVFSEPQFESKLVTVATEGTGAASGVLDPLGAELEDGPELYFELLRGMAGSLHDCLSQAG
ncbi:MAG: zinc ABC transporter substrate-binding protein [Brucellaceae bacterium]|nr:zinc ABC transporter substrate-binding protein [Brucellaceae bacterium]